MAKITYENKSALNTHPEIGNINKITDADMNEIKSVVNANDDTLISLNTLKPVLLWRNPNTSQGIAPQNITLSTADYDIIEVYFKMASWGSAIKAARGLKGYDLDMVMQWIDDTNNSPFLRARSFTYVNDTTLSLGIGYFQRTNSTNINTSSDNILPVYIIGYKLDITL